MEELRYDGRVAVVTGAGGNPGLGRTYALLLASRGARVVVNDLGVGPDGRGRVGTGPADVVAEIREAGGEAVVSTDSVATRDGARAIIDTALQAFGQVDIVINNAGIAPFALFDEITDNDIERVVSVHLMGHIWMNRAVWQHMADRGYGRIVNVSSGVAVLGMPYQSIYAAAKLGVVGLTRSLAAEGRSKGIKVNALMPAAGTLAWKTMLEPTFSERAAANNITPEVVAPVAAYLAHEICDFSGKVVQAQGGAVTEVFFSTTQGIPPDPCITPESVAESIGQVTQRVGAQDVPDPSGTAPEHLIPKPYTDTPRSTESAGTSPSDEGE